MGIAQKKWASKVLKATYFLNIKQKAWAKVNWQFGNNTGIRGGFAVLHYSC
jgi:hypothetical protein